MQAMRNRARFNEMGAISAEFVAIIIIVAAIIAAIWAVDIPSRVGDCAQTATDNLLTQGSETVEDC